MRTRARKHSAPTSPLSIAPTSARAKPYLGYVVHEAVSDGPAWFVLRITRQVDHNSTLDDPRGVSPPAG